MNINKSNFLLRKFKFRIVKINCIKDLHDLAPK